jgi:hypothetical protein
MGKTREVYPTVGELLDWIDRESVPSSWSMRRADYGIEFRSSDGASIGFSLVPEDEEVRDGVR